VSPLQLTYFPLNTIHDTVHIHSSVLLSASLYIVAGRDTAPSPHTHASLYSNAASNPTCIGNWGTGPLTSALTVSDDPILNEDPSNSDFSISNYDLLPAPNIKALDLLSTSFPAQPHHPPCYTPSTLYFRDASYFIDNPTLYLSAVPQEESQCDVYSFDVTQILVGGSAPPPFISFDASQNAIAVYSSSEADIGEYTIQVSGRLPNGKIGSASLFLSVQSLPSTVSLSNPHAPMFLEPL